MLGKYQPDIVTVLQQIPTADIFSYFFLVFSRKYGQLSAVAIVATPCIIVYRPVFHNKREQVRHGRCPESAQSVVIETVIQRYHLTINHYC